MRSEKTMTPRKRSEGERVRIRRRRHESPENEILCVWPAAKRRERERRRGGLTVPPPRPAFPKKTAAPGVAEKRVGEKTGVGKEEDLWASLEKREAEEERENGGRSSADAGETGHTHQTVPTITFSHSEKSKPLLPVVVREVGSWNFNVY